MYETINFPARRRSALIAPLALFALILATAMTLGAGSAGAAKAKPMGETKKTPKPSCPKSPCQAVGSVTGFQQRADGKKNLFKVRSPGHIVAWSAHLSKPDGKQRKFFGNFYPDETFGRSPAARIGILKPKGKGQFKLKKQSPAVALASELGSRPIFTLNRPLRVKEGDIVALTIPSWVPSFAVNLGRDNAWRASRSPKKCTGAADLKKSRSHEDKGSVRRYGCRYKTARLLYWAYLVKSGGKDRGGNKR